MDGTWRFGIKHPCVDDIDDVEGFILKTSRDTHIACVHVPYRDSHPRFAIIYSHPSGSDLSDHLIGVPSLKDMARFYRCDIYSYDYSGYGLSSGHPGEANQNADIRAVYEHLTKARKCSPDKVCLIKIFLKMVTK